MAGQLFCRASDKLKAKELGTGFNDIQRLRENVIGDEESVGFALLIAALTQRHGFCGSGGFVEQ